MEENDVRKQRLISVAKWGIGLVGAIVVAQVIFIAIKGLVGLAIAGTVGLAIINFAPVVAMKFAKKLIVAEAENNPIETMQNLYAEKSAERTAADQNIMDFETEVRNFNDQVEAFKQQYPSEAQSYETLSEKMGQALSGMKREQSAARRELSNFDQQITRAKAIYTMALAAQKVVKMSKSAEAQVFAKIKEQVAFDAVRTQLNRSFANLNLALERREDARAALPEGHPIGAISNSKSASR